MNEFVRTTATPEALCRISDTSLILELWHHFPEHMFLIRVEPERFVIEAVNPAQEATIGHPCCELTLDDILPADHACGVAARYRECLLRDQPMRYEEVGRFMNQQGEEQERHWLTLLVPLHDTHGATTHLFGISQNLTPLKMARSALERQNAELESQVAQRTAELEAANARLLALATHDELTGIANRRHLADMANRDIQRARRNGRPLSLIILDIDDFKAVNDHQGHVAGDLMLYNVAKALSNVLRESDTLGRYGGDEFVILLPDTDLANAGRTVERLRRAVAERCRCTISLGAAQFACHDGFIALVEAADRRLMKAKQQRQLLAKPP